MCELGLRQTSNTTAYEREYREYLTKFLHMSYQSLTKVQQTPYKVISTNSQALKCKPSAGSGASNGRGGAGANPAWVYIFNLFVTFFYWFLSIVLFRAVLLLL